MTDESTYPHLLQAAGFPSGDTGATTGQYDQAATQGGFQGAQGASQIEATKRKLAAAKQQLALKGQSEREGINNTMEDRGFFNSGQRLQGLAKQQGMEASQAAELEASAADDIANINANMQQAMTQSEIDAQKRQQENDLFQMQKDSMSFQQQFQMEQLKAQRDQMAIEKTLAREKLELAKKTAAGNYSE